MAWAWLFRFCARLGRGEANGPPAGTTRTVRDILRANLVTRFNALLGALLAVAVVVGPPQDMLFGLILAANVAIGVAQELRAKRTLDRLAIVVAPTARVWRDGHPRRLPASAVVLDDIVELTAGDQVVVDGVVLDGEAEIDESLLTGEAEPVLRRAGDALRSGSFAVAGAARYQANAVGEHAYARRLAAEARRFALAPSELRRGIDRILRLVSWVIGPTVALLVWSQLHASGLADALRGSVAGASAMVPEGLVLLTNESVAA